MTSSGTPTRTGDETTLCLGQRVQTNAWIWGQRSVVTGDIVAMRRGWFGRKRYLVRFSVSFTLNRPGDMGTETYAKWRRVARLWAAS